MMRSDREGFLFPEMLASGAESADPTVADGIWRCLDPRYVSAEKLVGWVVAVAVSLGWGAGAAVVWFLGWLPPWATWLVIVSWPFVAVGLAWFGQVHPRWEFEHTWYLVSALGIEIRKGIVWRTLISVPRSRIQHTDVSQGPIQRRFGISTLILHTAGTEHAAVELGGLAREQALRIRDFLLPGSGSDAV